MVKNIDTEVAYYYDSHSAEEDLMGETSLHSVLIRYLMGVLRGLFPEETCAIYENLNFYRTPNQKEHPVVPDIAVIKGTAFQHTRHWRVGRYGPAPQVVFEIASEETWQKDVEEKPAKYAVMGVQEYVFYDPNVPPLNRKESQRLWMWRLDTQERVMLPVPGDAQGRRWSEQLESWLVPDEITLRLYDRSGHMRLSLEEIHARRAEKEALRAKIEAQRAEIEAYRAKLEAQRAEKEAKRAALLAEKLRSLGIDPDQL